MKSTNHTDAVVNVGSDDEDCVSRQEIKLKDSEAHCKNTDNDGNQRDEQPVERLTAGVAHTIHNTPTLSKNTATLSQNTATLSQNILTLSQNKLTSLQHIDIVTASWKTDSGCCSFHSQYTDTVKRHNSTVTAHWHYSTVTLSQYTVTSLWRQSGIWDSQTQTCRIRCQDQSRFKHVQLLATKSNSSPVRTEWHQSRKFMNINEPQQFSWTSRMTSQKHGWC